MDRLLRLAAVGSCAVLAACGDQGTAPPDVGDLTVRVYLDRDPASPGSFTAGDSAFANVALTLAPTGTLGSQGSTASLTATTDAQGLATFTGVPAGQYVVGLANFTGPAGSVLTGSPTPAVLVPFRSLGGRPASAEFRFAFFPGRVAGTVFRDLNGNGSFDPGTDVTAALAVRLTRDSAGTQQLQATTVGVNATYAFENVAPGTYFVQFAAPAGFSFGAAGTSRRVVVAPSGATTLNATYATVTTPIATVRTLPVGTAVVIAGVLTSRPGQMGGGAQAEVWVQDETGGIATFGAQTSDSTRLLVGTRVEVTTAVAAPFNGQAQLGTGATPPTFLVLGQATPVAPVVQTGTQVNARTLEGRLVSLPGFRVTSIGAGATAFTVFGTTADNATVQVRVGSALAGITRTTFVVGSTYTVTGPLSQFNGTAQLKPRTPADIVLTP
jgi:hypothetical protein